MQIQWLANPRVPPGGLNDKLRFCVEKLLEEQKYAKLRVMLQDLRHVDPRLACKMRISIDRLKKSIQDEGSMRFNMIVNVFNQNLETILESFVGRSHASRTM